MVTITSRCLPTCTTCGHGMGCPSFTATACAVPSGPTLFTALPFAAGQPIVAEAVSSKPSVLTCPCCAAKLSLVVIAPGTCSPGGLSLQQMSPKNTAG
jgi:hypothetical protein